MSPARGIRRPTASAAALLVIGPFLLTGCLRFLRTGPVPVPPALPLTVKTLYVTDRAPEPFDPGKCDPVQDADRIRTYGRTAAAGLAFGSFPVTILREHRTGKLAEPLRRTLECRQPRRKPFVAAHPAPLSEEEFFRELEKQVALAPRAEVLVFVHGFNLSFEEAARRGAQLGYDLGFEGPVIVYSWPTQESARKYREDEKAVAATTEKLREFLAGLARRQRPGSVHLLAHSMGNRALVEALEALASSGGSAPRFGQVVLAAPDVDADDIRQAAPALARLAARVTMYASVVDRALIAAHRLREKARAGESGEHVLVVPGIDTVDVSGVNDDLLGHSYYGDNRSVLSDIYHLLRHNTPPEERFSLFRIPRDAGFYWAFRP